MIGIEGLIAVLCGGGLTVAVTALTVLELVLLMTSVLMITLTWISMLESYDEYLKTGDLEAAEEACKKAMWIGVEVAFELLLDELIDLLRGKFSTGGADGDGTSGGNGDADGDGTSGGDGDADGNGNADGDNTSDKDGEDGNSSDGDSDGDNTSDGDDNDGTTSDGDDGSSSGGKGDTDGDNTSGGGTTGDGSSSGGNGDVDGGNTSGGTDTDGGNSAGGDGGFSGESGKYTKPSINLNIDSQQLGKKWGKHKYDYPNLTSYTEYEQLAKDIFNNPDKIILDSTNGEYFYINGEDLLRVTLDGEFVSLYPGVDTALVNKALEGGGLLWEK